jgi:hypothetical protein
VRGRRLVVTIDHEGILFELEGERIEVWVRGVRHLLDSSEPTSIPLA